MRNGTEQMKTAAKRADQLQFLRFLAFLNVFISHAESWNFFGYPASNSARFAVSFFFCLSGLVTGYSGFGKEVRLSLPAMGKHMAGKIWKVYPLYFLTMTIPLLNTNLPQLIALRDWDALREPLTLLGRNLLLIQSWFQEGFFYLNGVGWFLSTLLFLNVFDLLGVYLLNKAQKSEKRYFLFAFGAFSVLMLAMLHCGLTRAENRGYWHYIFPPARLGEYLLGMILGFVLRPLVGKVPEGPRTKPLFTVLEVGAMLLWWGYLYTKGPYWLRSSIHWVLPNLVLLGVFTLGKGWVSDLFRKKPLVYLGDISFECFLIHQLLVVRYEITHGWAIATPADQMVAFFYCMTITLVAAMLLHRGKK